MPERLLTVHEAGEMLNTDIGAADSVSRSSVVASCADATSVSGTGDLRRFHWSALG